MGDFASKDPNNNAAGFAKGGLLIDLGFNLKLNKNFGLTALIRRQSSTTDAQAMADEISKNFGAGTTTTVNSGNWVIGGYMGGASGSFPLNDKISIETKALIGFLTASSPSIKIDITDGSNSVWVEQEKASSTAFSYLIGAGLKFDLSDKFCLLANIDYLGSNPEFVGVVTKNSLGQSEKDTWSQGFSTLNYSVGLGYKF